MFHDGNCEIHIIIATFPISHCNCDAVIAANGSVITVWFYTLPCVSL